MRQKESLFSLRSKSHFHRWISLYPSGPSLFSEENQEWNQVSDRMWPCCKNLLGWEHDAGQPPPKPVVWPTWEVIWLPCPPWWCPNLLCAESCASHQPNPENSVTLWGHLPFGGIFVLVFASLSPGDRHVSSSLIFSSM